MVASCFRGLSTRPTHSSTSQVCVIFSRRKASESEVKQGEQWGGESEASAPAYLPSPASRLCTNLHYGQRGQLPRHCGQDS